MAPSLLKTKLYIPPVRPGLVQRPRLIEQLNESLRPGCRLTLVSAPAGFGKTTLLTDWIRHVQHPVAWLSLDSGDNDPARFWSYLVSALQTVRAGIGQTAAVMLQSPQRPPIESILTALVNEIASTEVECMLVLDDYHVITEPTVNDSLAFLIDHLPQPPLGGIHLVLASRADPPWPLARLRVRGELAELRTEDMRFTIEEATAFLNGAMSLDLSPQDVALLDTRTEGWIAGLQLAALAMQGISVQGRTDATGFVQAFGGSNRFVLDYLVEEVLSRQTDDIRAFLIQTSILERLTASLCDAVLHTDRLDSQEILAQLDKNNLFLIPLDDERRWYRYHNLFADLLSNRLLERDPDHISALHHRASLWFEKRGMTREAISHALRAEDLDETERLIARNALAMILDGELSTLVTTMQQLPQAAVRSRPWLSVGYAWTLVHTSQFDAAGALLENIEGTLREHPPAEQAEEKQLAGHIAAVRGYLTYFKGDLDQAIHFTRTALEQLPASDARARAYVAVDLAGMLGRAASQPQAVTEAILKDAIATSLSADDLPTVVYAYQKLVGQYSATGQLNNLLAASRKAIRFSNEYAKQVGQRTPAIGRVYVLAGGTLYHQNDLAAAERYIRQAIEIYAEAGQPQGLSSSYVTLSRSLQARHAQEAALAAMHDAREIDERVSPWFAGFGAAWEALLHLDQGNRASAVQWAQECGLRFDDEVSLHSYVKHIILARVLVAQGRDDRQHASSERRLEQAEILLNSLVDLAESTQANRYLIESLIVRAVALQAQGRTDQALADIGQALALAKPEGFARLFINEGPAMGTLLKQAIARGVVVDYAKGLLAELEEEQPIAAAAPKRPTLPPPIDPLSKRELDVLRLLPTHLSSTEIASQLYISKNTVRSHIGHIYDKLGVHSREYAVQRAHELGLL